LGFDEFLNRKIDEGRKTRAGRFLDSLSRSGGVSRLALLNIILTATLGFIITYPLHATFGLHAALPTAIVTIIPITIIFICVLDHNLGGRMNGKTLRLSLLFAIFFSLPFGILSLPLLYSMLKRK
jgi:hypothetical protein